MPHRNESRELFNTNEMAISFDYESDMNLVIDDVSWSSEGTWICEVCADRTFQKDSKIVQMTVIGSLTDVLIMFIG